jgi:REP element-mobilizing transposase RayT
MSYVRLWVHAVWSTKNREPSLDRKFRKKLFDHIRENARAKNIRLLEINGVDDHVHCLFLLSTDMSIAKTLMLIKGESAHWANQTNLFGYRIEWQREYYAGSIDDSNLEKIRHYIRNQEQHHRMISYQNEFDDFMNDDPLLAA